MVVGSGERRSEVKSLYPVIASLVAWQQREKPKTAKRCLEAIRYACTENQMILPRSNVDYKGLLAITCGETLAKNPAKWGWVRLTEFPRDLLPSLVFFERCGILPDGRVAGHVSVYKPSTEHHISNATYDMNKWWRSRVKFIFRPL